MKLNILNQVFSFHDFHLTNLEVFDDKVILSFDEGIYFEKKGEKQVDYIMTNPKLILEKTDTSFTKEELEEVIENIIHAFNSDFDKNIEIDDIEGEIMDSVEINLLKDGKYKKISIEEFLKLNFEIINESFGYGYMRFFGIVTDFDDKEEWQNASLEIFYNNESKLIYESLEKL